MEKLNSSSNSSSTSWLSDLLLEEMEIDVCDLFQQREQNLFGEEEFLSHDIESIFQQEENFQHQPLLSSESYSSSYPLEKNLERPNKKLKKNTTSQILSFDCTLNTKKNKVVPFSQTQLPQNRKGSLQKQNIVETTKSQGQGTKRSVAHNQDHIIAERKRREKLSQCLIALAALIPGLKKMDKASVLGDAIKYVKELQERLRVLEEQNKNNSHVQSMVTVDEPQLSSDSSNNDDSEAASGNNETLPHVEAKVLDKDVLIRIHCQKQKGLLLKILVEIQKLHLFVVNNSVLPFGDSILDITIVAQMGTGYNLTRNDLVKKLRVAALRAML